MDIITQKLKDIIRSIRELAVTLMDFYNQENLKDNYQCLSEPLEHHHYK